jgi:hypothetical protein
MKIRPVLTPEEERSRRTQKKRAQRRRQAKRLKNATRELKSQNDAAYRRLALVEFRLLRTLKVAAAALERCEVADDPSGAAAEAEALLRQVVQLDGTYVPHADEDDDSAPYPERVTCARCDTSDLITDDPINGWVGYSWGFLCPACADDPMFEPPMLDAAMRAGKPGASS